MRDDSVTDRLAKIAHHNWPHARPLALSDAGLLADLDERIGEAGHLLALDGHDDDE